MAFRYNIIDQCCPECGKTLKRNDEGLWTILAIILFIATAGTILFWLLGWKIIDALYKIQGPRRLGNKIKECPECGATVCMARGMEWVEFNVVEKKSWAYRRIYKWAIGLSGFVFVGLVAQFFWLSPHESDRPITTVFLIILLASFAIEAVLFALWKAAVAKPYIEMNDEDFALVSKSMKATYSAWDNEPIPVKIKGTETTYGKARESAPKDDLNDQARRLLIFKELLDKGAITPEEYEAKKRQILGL
jgi:ribosomal protein S27AE